MAMPPIKDIVNLSLVVVMVVSILILAVTRKKGSGQYRGIGARAIQWLTVSLAFPTIAILALENALPREAVITSIGVIVGHTLSTFVERKAGDEQ
jgi:hypothetical protein